MRSLLEHTLDAMIGWLEIASLAPIAIKITWAVAVGLAALFGFRLAFPVRRKDGPDRDHDH